MVQEIYVCFEMTDTFTNIDSVWQHTRGDKENMVGSPKRKGVQRRPASALPQIQPDCPDHAQTSTTTAITLGTTGDVPMEDMEKADTAGKKAAKETKQPSASPQAELENYTLKYVLKTDRKPTITVPQPLSKSRKRKHNSDEVGEDEDVAEAGGMFGFVSALEDLMVEEYGPEIACGCNGVDVAAAIDIKLFNMEMQDTSKQPN